MPVKCKVQERPTQLTGYVEKINGQDGEWQTVRFTFTDVDNSTFRATIDLNPHQSSAPFVADSVQTWDVTMKALSNLLGDTAICFTQICVEGEVYELQDRAPEDE